MAIFRAGKRIGPFDIRGGISRGDFKSSAYHKTDRDPRFKMQQNTENTIGRFRAAMASAEGFARPSRFAVRIFPPSSLNQSLKMANATTNRDGQVLDNEMYNGDGQVNFNVSGATYNQFTGVMVLTIGSHTLKVGTSIKLANASLTFSTSSGNVTYPQSGDTAFNTAININAVTSTTITINIGPATNQNAHSFVSASGNAVISGGNYTHTWAGGTAIKAVTTGGLTLASGELDLDIGPHGLQNSDKILIALDSIGFTCTMDNHDSEHAYPRATDPAANAALGLAVAQSNSSIRINVGSSLSGGFVAPLEMELIASILENSTA